MKYINAILSIIFLLLSCMPCADAGASSTHPETEVSSKSDNHSHDKGSDLCSPFCICNCCGSIITSFSPSGIIEFPLPTSDIKTQLPTYTSILSSNFYGSIWQPPQIA